MVPQKSYENIIVNDKSIAPYQDIFEERFCLNLKIAK